MTESLRVTLLFASLSKIFSICFSLQFNVFKLDSLAPFIHNDDNKWFCNKDDTCYQNWLDMKFPPNAVWDKQYKTPCYTDYMTGRFRVGQIYHHKIYSEVFSVLFPKNSQIVSKLTTATSNTDAEKSSVKIHCFCLHEN